MKNDIVVPQKTVTSAICPHLRPFLRAKRDRDRRVAPIFCRIVKKMEVRDVVADVSRTVS